MFGIFKSETPRYKGEGQPNGNSQEVLGSLSRLVGGTKPTYRGMAQAVTSSGLFGWFAGSSPAYRTASPEVEPVPEAAPEEPVPPPEPEPEVDDEVDVEVEPEGEPDEELEPESELEPCEPEGEGNGEGEAVDLDPGEPLLARVPVTIVIRRGME